MKIRMSFWDDAFHCGASERLLPIHNFPRAGIAEPSLSSNVSLDIPGDCAVCTYVRGGNGLKHGKQFTIFLLHIRKVKYMTLIVQRLGRKDANLFPVFAFRMLPSSADMRHVPRSEGQES